MKRVSCTRLVLLLYARTVELWFRDADLATVCNRHSSIRARWGPLRGRAIKLKLQQMRAVSNLDALSELGGNLRPDHHGLFRLDAHDLVIQFKLERFSSELNKESGYIVILAILEHKPSGRKS